MMQFEFDYVFKLEILSRESKPLPYVKFEKSFGMLDFLVLIGVNVKLDVVDLRLMLFPVWNSCDTA